MQEASITSLKSSCDPHAAVTHLIVADSTRVGEVHDACQLALGLHNHRKGGFTSNNQHKQLSGKQFAFVPAFSPSQAPDIATTLPQFQ
jgi:hypothetical protein